MRNNIFKINVADVERVSPRTGFPKNQPASQDDINLDIS